MASALISCRWDWCRSSFLSIDALDTHVKHEHIWPMKPLRKTEIALMRRMDMQSLHSSINTQSSIVSRGPSETPQDKFNASTLLSSPLQSDPSSMLPVSPAFEGLVRKDGHSRLTAMFERTHDHTPSSASSQEAITRQLTQDNAGSQSQPQIEDGLVDTELRWPTDDEEEICSPEQHVSAQNHLPRGLNSRCGSLTVPLDNSPPNSSADSQSQQFILQTQAPYPSQTTDWSL